MYMRRSGIAFETIAKVTGHKNLESLIKHYDLKLEVGAENCKSYSDHSVYHGLENFRVSIQLIPHP